MVIHVGINPEYGDLSYYDESKNEVSTENETRKNFDLKIESVNYDEIENVSLVFDEVKSTINGKLGYLCILLNENYGNEIRKKFIESGLKAGFKNIEIINIYTAIYINAMSQKSYNTSSGEIFWIKEGDHFYVWQIIDQKAKFIGKWEADPSNLSDMQKVMKESKLIQGPNIVLYDGIMDRTILIKISRCQFSCYKWDNNLSSEGVLLKARIASEDKDVAHLDTLNFLSQETKLTIGVKNIVSYKCGHELPILYSKKISKNRGSNRLIIKQLNNEESFELPNHEEIYFTFQIDENEIYTLIFNEHSENESGKKQLTTNTWSDEFPTMLNSTFLQSSDILKNYFTIPKINTSLDIKFDAIGIDLGTSRCCVAVNRKNGIQTIPLGNTGERLLPSYVSYDEKNVKCGQIVIDRLRHWANSTVFDSKRLIGRNMDDIEIDSNWSFQIIHENNKPLIKVKGSDGVKHLKAEQVSAELLKYIKQKAEDFQGIPLSNAVITVPAAFTEEQKNATLEAAEIAGWKNIVLLLKSVAAAFAYFIDHPAIDNSTVLLFDLGGGAFDVCIFQIKNNKIKIISNTGDTKLGGRDFDTVLVNHFTNLLGTKYGITIKDEKKYKLMIKCQQIKETLSEFTSCGLGIDAFDPFQDGIVDVTRIEYEKMTIQLQNKIRNTLSAALFNSGFQANAIEKVLLIGGGSRMPMIKHLLQETFPNAQQCCHENPDEVVAIGAAFFAINNVF